LRLPLALGADLPVRQDGGAPQPPDRGDRFGGVWRRARERTAQPAGI